MNIHYDTGVSTQLLTKRNIMTCKNGLLILLCILLTACANTRPKTATSYHASNITPSMTEGFALMNKKVFDEPMLGVQYKYENKSFPEDLIDIYIYPIGQSSWEDTDTTLNGEIHHALQDIDTVIKHGIYKSRSTEQLTDFIFTHEKQKFTGKKAQLTITNPQDELSYSDIYLFIAQDKFIKFRTSFNSKYTRKWTGDDIVKELLPEINVPTESVYMKNIRAEHKKKMQQDLMEVLMQALKQANSEAPKSD